MPEITGGTSALTALRLAEEEAAGRYLAARREMLRLRSQVTAIGRLVSQHPRRLDYRASLRTVATAHGAAVQRVQLAYERWQQAQLRSDSYWTDTAGRAA
ncbi:hypothetical protein [Amycolatopsis thermoflava]|uniref:hypothetical protein n=1 Tax=Amycolatopsis thermoflava TaxID=84480 RepID=UPI003EBF151A